MWAYHEIDHEDHEEDRSVAFEWPVVWSDLYQVFSVLPRVAGRSRRQEEGNFFAPLSPFRFMPITKTISVFKMRTRVANSTSRVLKIPQWSALRHYLASILNNKKTPPF